MYFPEANPSTNVDTCMYFIAEGGPHSGQPSTCTDK